MTSGDIDDAPRELLPRLRRFAQWLTRDASSADDLVQARLERSRSRWSSRHAAGALRAWLFSILYRQFLDGKRRSKRYNAMLDHFRGGRVSVIRQGDVSSDHPRNQAGYGDAAQPSVQPSVQRECIAQSVIKALEQLPAEQRTLLLWIAVGGLTYREVAEMLDVPIGTVMSRLSRARQALRRLSDGVVVAAPSLRLVK